jgi:alcohol dehydrogenase
METNLLLNLRKFLSPEIVYGEGALALAGRHALNLGATRVFIVTDPGVQQNGWAARVEESLLLENLEFITFSDVSCNPKDTEVMAGAEIYRNEKCDLIMAVGGGSPMDCAKGIGVVVSNSGSIIDFEGIDVVASPVPPLIFIPTTAGSSADVSQFAIITDTARNLKVAIISKMVIPDIALVDPQTTITMAPELTAATGMDALCHAFEAYVSTVSSPLTDMAALRAVRLISENLLSACHEPHNMEARNNMMMASLMAGLAFSNASLGLVHGMAHSLGGLLGLAHGECNAILLEKVVQYNYDSVPERYDRLVAEMGEPVDEIEPSLRGVAAATCIEKLRRQLGISVRLKEMGVSLGQLPQLASYAFQDPCLATNPKKTNLSDIESIYRSIYQ